MPHWEHVCIIKSVKNFEALATVLNDYGNDGWETVSCERENSFRNDYHIVFKRMVPVSSMVITGLEYV